MRTTRKEIEARVRRATEQLKTPTGYHWNLSIMNPGDGVRYCIELVHNVNYGQKLSLPPAHYKTRDFLLYLEGLIDGIEYQGRK